MCRDIGKARAHVNYIAFRSREREFEDRGAFSRVSDHADVRAFNERLEDHATRHPMANKAYKIHISLSEREFRERELTSWKPIVREAMENLEKRWGVRLQWIAAEHMARGHPHVHIVLKAAHVNDRYQHRQLRVDPERLKDLRQEVDRSLERQRPRVQERPRGLDLSRGDMMLRIFDIFLRGLEKAAQESEREQERELEYRRRRSRDDDRDRER